MSTDPRVIALDRNLRDLSRRFNKTAKLVKAGKLDERAFDPLYEETRMLRAEAESLGVDIKMTFKNQFGGVVH